MREVIFVRHAKSSWSDHTLKDFDRPLNKRGKFDAPLMAEKFKESFKLPDILISSSANRAKITAKHFLNTWDSKIDLQLEKQLYHGYSEDYEMVLNLVPNGMTSVMFFGHNPGLTYIANDHADFHIENVPTTGIFILNSKSNQWEDFFKTAKLTTFIFPKMYK